MVFKEKLSGYRKEIDRELEQFFEKKKESFDTSNGVVNETLKMMEDYVTRGGKRIRPALVMASYSGLNGEDPSEVVKVAASLELMHASLLSHDDIIDESPIRRGGETPHEWLKTWCIENSDKEIEDVEKFGEDIAVIAGDLYTGMALEMISESDIRPDKKEDILEMYQRTYQVTNIGQILDVWIHEGEENVSEKDNYEIMDRKTVAYTFENPIKIGALLAGELEEKIYDIEELSKHLGRAFQIKDDLLDIYADKEELGKQVLTDLREGKRTLPILKAIENGTEEQVEKIFSLMGKEDLTIEDVDAVRDIVKFSGALEKCEDILEANVEESKNWVSKIGFEDEIDSFFREMAEFIAERNY